MLNAVEVKVLIAVKDSLRENNRESIYSDEVKIEGMNANKIGGYLSQLSQKGYISTVRLFKDDRYTVVLITEKAEREYFSGDKEK